MWSQKDFLSTVERLACQGTDDAAVEVKACSGGLGKSVWESVSAFANTRGGYLVLGLSEERGFLPAEGFDIDRVCDQFVSGMEGSPSQQGVLENPPQYELGRFERGNAAVLVVEVHEADPLVKPCFIRSRGVGNGSYKRVDDKDIRLSQTEVYELRNAFVPSPADRSIVEEARLGDLDPQLVGRLLDAMRGSRALRGAQGQEAQLTRLSVITPEGGVRLGGLLALGYYPQQFFPKLVIDVAAHPANEKSAPGGVRFVDRTECEGALGEAIEEAVAATARNLRRASVVDGVKRVDLLEIPEEVLREAVVNAAVHREYGERFRGQAVSVDVYPNRVEVCNPGGLWGGKTPENLADGTSRCRNETLMRLMRSVPGRSGLGVFAEGQGSGISFMLRTMGERGLPAPEFRAGIDSFRVVFWREAPDVAVAGVSAAKEAEAFGAGIGVASADLAATGTTEETSAAQQVEGTGPERVLAVLAASAEPVGVRDIAAAAGLKLSTARAYLRALVGEGTVQPTAGQTSRNRKYRLS